MIISYKFKCDFCNRIFESKENPKEYSSTRCRCKICNLKDDRKFQDENIDNWINCNNDPDTIKDLVNEVL